MRKKCGTFFNSDFLADDAQGFNLRLRLTVRQHGLPHDAFGEGIMPSVNALGCSYGNACMESFFAGIQDSGRI